ncbi:MAG: RNA methyltransferase, partial [Phyllobacterium sp.]|nr:RNA methyltransferase [Phyllobacterium sp.]
VVSLDYFSPKTPRGSGAPEGRKREKPAAKKTAAKPAGREDIPGDE